MHWALAEKLMCLAVRAFGTLLIIEELFAISKVEISQLAERSLCSFL